MFWMQILQKKTIEYILLTYSFEMMSITIQKLWTNKTWRIIYLNRDASRQRIISIREHRPSRMTDKRGDICNVEQGNKGERERETKNQFLLLFP